MGGCVSKQSLLKEAEAREEAEAAMRKVKEDAEQKLQTQKLESEQALKDQKSKAAEIIAKHQRKNQEREAKLEAKLQKIIIEAEQVESSLSEQLESVKEDWRDQARGEFQQAFALEAKLRRKIHEELMTIKGNIRVFCRVRPMLGNELKAGEQAVVGFPTEDGQKQAMYLLQKDRSGAIRKHRFLFNRTLDMKASQQEVFEDVEQLCGSVLDGNNVCIFAYGQTGSGKTYTMEGTDSEQGITFRAIKELWASSSRRMLALRESWAMEVSVYEIYNESVCDLLAAANANAAGDEAGEGGGEGQSARGRGKGAKGRGKTQAQHSAEWNSSTVTGKAKKYAASKRPTLRVQAGEVCGLVGVRTTSYEEVVALLRRGHKQRASASHELNDRSSRSHMLLSLGVWAGKDGSKLSGSLHLVDLAGSERVSKTKVQREQLVEAQHINKSLSALGDVVSALVERRKHVPYRNSKRAKVLMIVTVSPSASCISESVASLQFASRCGTLKPSAFGGSSSGGSSSGGSSNGSGTGSSSGGGGSSSGSGSGSSRVSSAAAITSVELGAESTVESDAAHVETSWTSTVDGARGSPSSSASTSSPSSRKTRRSSTSKSKSKSKQAHTHTHPAQSAR